MNWNLNYKDFFLFAITFQACFLFTDSLWDNWGTWSTCTATCGPGIRSRQRTCISGICTGSDETHMTCMEAECVKNEVDENEWSVWGEWSGCTRTCGGGSRQRVRMCSSGVESDCCKHSSEESCRLEYTQSRECINEDCFGVWSDWRPWEACSAGCGDGTQTRQRMCEPENSVCVGSGQQTRSCYVQCPISQNLKTNIEDLKSCGEAVGNPCDNGGTCVDGENGVSCLCQGDWRGRTCSTLCLYSNNKFSCENKRGIFHDCGDCHKFIICSRTGSLVSIKCTGNRIWTGDGCRSANETCISCFDDNSAESSTLKR